MGRRIWRQTGGPKARSAESLAEIQKLRCAQKSLSNGIGTSFYFIIFLSPKVLLDRACLKMDLCAVNCAWKPCGKNSLCIFGRLSITLPPKQSPAVSMESRTACHRQPWSPGDALSGKRAFDASEVLKGGGDGFHGRW